jgi:hypothetical protein
MVKKVREDLTVYRDVMVLRVKKENEVIAVIKVNLVSRDRRAES